MRMTDEDIHVTRCVIPETRVSMLGVVIKTECDEPATTQEPSLPATSSSSQTPASSAVPRSRESEYEVDEEYIRRLEEQKRERARLIAQRETRRQINALVRRSESKLIL